jgi:5-hydroxyisourate hydrolase-like protein (transthyretin family)
LIRVHPGCRSTRYHIDPDNAAVIAALEYAKDAIVSEIVNSSQSRPQSVPLTKMQVEAWDNMKEAFGDDLGLVNYPSANEIAQNAISELKFLVDQMLENENVKKSYEDFVLMAKLCGQENNSVDKC